MRLFEDILAVNQRRIAGDSAAAIRVEDHASALPLAALTCIDARLNALLPNMLGVPDDKFIWLRNAGNIITGPLSSTMRSLALACAVKGGREIAVIGHSDCQVGKMSMLQLLDRLGALGVDRHQLPENLVEYFGLFGSERQNVIRSVEHIRNSPLIGRKIPVHGLMIDLHTGKLDWVVNGYQVAETVSLPARASDLLSRADQSLDKLARIGNTAADELNLPKSRIGEAIETAHEWLHKAEHVAAAVSGKPPTPPVLPPTPPPAAPPRPPLAPIFPLNPLTSLQEKLRQRSGEKQSGSETRKH